MLLSHSYTEISSCGRRNDLLEYFAYIAGYVLCVIIIIVIFNAMNPFLHIQVNVLYIPGLYHPLSGVAKTRHLLTYIHMHFLTSLPLINTQPIMLNRFMFLKLVH